MNYDPGHQDNGSCVAVVSVQQPRSTNYDPAVNVDDGSCESMSCLGCIISTACNFDPEATQDDGSCDFLSCLGFGCTLEAACNYVEEARERRQLNLRAKGVRLKVHATRSDSHPHLATLSPAQGARTQNAYNYDENATIDGACVYAGCTIFHACNYDATATVNDDSCDYESCAGCQIAEACNYNPEATLFADCIFVVEGYDCLGNCLIDSDMDGVCDEFDTGNEGAGCTDPSNSGYDPNAILDDSCFVGGCLLEFQGQQGQRFFGLVDVRFQCLRGLHGRERVSLGPP